jgi:hypothetical protein
MYTSDEIYWSDRFQKAFKPFKDKIQKLAKKNRAPETVQKSEFRRGALCAGALGSHCKVLAQREAEVDLRMDVPDSERIKLKAIRQALIAYLVLWEHESCSGSFLICREELRNPQITEEERAEVNRHATENFSSMEALDSLKEKATQILRNLGFFSP